MNIAIVTGGESGEREISLQSAQFVEEVIDFARTTPFVFPEEKQLFIDRVGEFDLAIPVGHGAGIEDGSVQGFFTHLNIPFIFSGIATHAIGMDKVLTKRLVQALGLETPPTTTAFPCFAKPRSGGSSVASQYCESLAVLRQLQETHPGVEFLQEEPIKGRECTVGVIERDGKPVALPVIEIKAPGEFFDYDSKYNPEKLAAEICPAEIDASLAEELQRRALLVHQELGARHLSRCDFIIIDTGEIYFLEINTIPGLTSTSLIPKMIRVAGYSFADMLEEWCREVLQEK